MLKGIKDLKNVRANALHYSLASTPQTSSSNMGEISEPVKTTKKTSAFYDDYRQRKSKDSSQKSTSLLSNAIKNSFDGIKKNILENAEHYSKTDKEKTDTAKRKGNAIKSNIQNVLSKKYGELDTRHIFDDVDEKDIEENISTAESTIKTNIDKGFLSKDFVSKLPNLRDGLALSYAAANKGNNKAATKAREAAYMEDDPLVKETGMKLLATQLPKFENAVMPTNEKTKMTTQPTKHSSFYDDYLNNKKFQDNKKLWNPIGKTYVFPEENKNPRYVKADVLNMRSAPGTGSKIVGTLTNGTEVNFTGRKTEEIDGHLWAEVEYGGKKGWVAADYLKEEKPKNSSSHDHQDSSFSAPVISQKPKPSVSVDSSNNGSKIDINDHSALQTAFSQVRKTGATADDIGEPGDFDGSGELQCPDVPKWFISKFTTLSPVRGNGKEQVENLANTYGLEVSTTPCAPAVFSVAGGSSGPGTSGRNDGGDGHTGIILSCELTESGDYKLTYFHTYHSLLKDGMTSDIRERTFTPEELKNTTFLDLKDYMI